MFLDDEGHDIELEPESAWTAVPRTFWVDGVRYSLGNRFQRSAQAVFELAGRPATLEYRVDRPTFRAGLRTAFGGELRNLPAIFIAYALGGSGVGGGAVGASAAGSATYHVSYELVVAGQAQGTWVLSHQGDASEWTFLPPGATWRSKPPAPEHVPQVARGLVLGARTRRALAWSAALALVSYGVLSLSVVVLIAQAVDESRRGPDPELGMTAVGMTLLSLVGWLVVTTCLNRARLLAPRSMRFGELLGLAALAFGAGAIIGMLLELLGGSDGSFGAIETVVGGTIDVLVVVIVFGYPCALANAAWAAAAGRSPWSWAGPSIGVSPPALAGLVVGSLVFRSIS